MDLKYKIRNLHCSYARSIAPVLIINELDVPAGEVVFFIGESGVGKSTLIESVGLMSDTIQQQNDTSLLYFKENEELDILKLWNKGSSALSAFRSKEYSFIFQSTNLFEDLSIIDNVIIPSFNVKGEKRSEVTSRAQGYLAQLLTNVSESEYDTKFAGALSGGQKQRLAFVRALTSPHSVIFCDEPTGNLDTGNAKRLMKMLRDRIKERKSTAMIVSHDIPLALDFADRIILMTKEITNNGETYGAIKKENQFVKQADGAWKAGERRMTRFEFHQFLEKHFENN
jgi:ABC-type lipoprotein export system ATPase subunit